MIVHDCPLCEHTDTARMRLVDHVRSEHPEITPYCITDLPPGRPVDRDPQWTRICCRSCGRDTARTDTDPMFRHVDDDTPACVDPDTLKPYTTPKEKNPMTRIRPTTAVMRDWYSSLDDETRSDVRSRVAALLDGGTSQPDAWTIVQTNAEIEATPVFDRVVHPTPEPAPTKRAPKPASDATAPAERPRGRQPALVSYWLNDKPKRNLSDLAYDATGGLVDDAPRMTAAQFRAYLAANGVEAPESTVWSLDLPNGKTARTTLRDEQRIAS